MLSAADLPVLPAALVTVAGLRRERDARAGQAVVELDTQSAIDAAVKYLREEAPIAIEGDGGDSTTIRIINRVGDFGISASLCLDLMQEHWDERCVPPWEQQLKAKVLSAYRSRQNPIGCAHPEAKAREFDTIAEPPALTLDELFPTAERWLFKEPENDPHIIDRMLPKGFVSIIVSAGGRGKSTLALQMMAAVASGTELLGLKVEERGVAVGMFCEDTEMTLHRRFRAVCREVGADFEKIAPTVRLRSFIRDDCELWRGKQKAPLFDAINHAIEAIPDVKLLIVDGSADTFSGNEVDRAEVTAFMRLLTGLAAERGIAILLSMHESKSSADDDINATSGSTAWINKARSVIKLGRRDASELQKLTHIRSSVGPQFKEIVCQRVGDAFRFHSTVSERAEECAHVVAALIDQAIDDGVDLRVSPRAENFVIDWVVARLPADAGYTRDDVLTAYRDHLDGKLFKYVETYGPKSRKPRKRLVRT